MGDDIAVSAKAHLQARLRSLHEGEPNTDGKYVLLWQHQARRLHYNHALQHAVFRAREHGVPLLIVEDLYVGALECASSFCLCRCGHARFTRRMCAQKHVYYLPWIEREAGQLDQAFPELINHAVDVVTDDDALWCAG